MTKFQAIFVVVEVKTGSVVGFNTYTESFYDNWDYSSIVEGNIVEVENTDCHISQELFSVL